jgi:hypothetical protein
MDVAAAEGQDCPDPTASGDLTDASGSGLFVEAADDRRQTRPVHTTVTDLDGHLLRCERNQIMKSVLSRMTLLALLATTPVFAMAFPVKVHPAGGEGQTVVMCPDCNQPIACAKAGDYNIAFSADIDHPKNGGVVRFHVRLTDLQGLPVTNTRVALVLSMVGHEHQPRTLQLKGGRNGLYTATTSFRSIDMQGPWKADVQLKTPKGDVVTEAFTFNR